MADELSTTEDERRGYANFLTLLWQEVENLLYQLNEANICDEELAHISGVSGLNPEVHYHNRHDATALTPPRLAQLMIRELVNYREDHLPYYQAPNAPFLSNRRNPKSAFWLGWGL